MGTGHPKSLFSSTEKKECFVKFNVNGLLRGDYQSRMQGYAVGRQNRWLCADDIRELEDMNKLPEGSGGGTYLVNGNMVGIAHAGTCGGSEVLDRLGQPGADHLGLQVAAL
jgi:hypothetical protein